MIFGNPALAHVRIDVIERAVMFPTISKCVPNYETFLTTADVSDNHVDYSLVAWAQIYCELLSGQVVTCCALKEKQDTYTYCLQP